MKFNHSGHMGDVLYALHFIREFSEIRGEKPSINIQWGVAETGVNLTHPNGNVRLTKEATEFIAPLLRKQEWIEEVTTELTIPEGYIDLDEFRKLPMNYSAGDIRDYVYGLSTIPFPRNFHEKIIEVEKVPGYENTTITTFTKRYVNPTLDYTLFQRINDLTFVGLPFEYDLFREKSQANVGFIQVTNAYELAQIIRSCKLFIGNQCGIYAIAEMLKVPRILLTADLIESNSPGKAVYGCPNVLPLGGTCMPIRTAQQMKQVFEKIF